MARKKSMKLRKPRETKKKVEATAKVMTDFEKIVKQVCNENNFGFEFQAHKIAGMIPDFVNIGKRRIIEVFYISRPIEDIQKRAREFARRGYRYTYLSDRDFTSSNWRVKLINKIRGFLK